MAHKKAGTTTRLGRDSQSQRLGVKLFEGQWANPGNILIRQRGTKFYPGDNVMIGKDDTIFATAGGFVKFTHKARKRFDGARKMGTYVHVRPKTGDEEVKK